MRRPDKLPAADINESSLETLERECRARRAVLLRGSGAVAESVPATHHKRQSIRAAVLASKDVSVSDHATFAVLQVHHGDLPVGVGGRPPDGVKPADVQRSYQLAPLSLPRDDDLSTMV